LIHVALDTTFYREKPRLNSPEFKALVFLVKNKCICLHIPFIVENEFRSHLEIDQKQKVDTAISTLQKICEYPNFFVVVITVLKVTINSKTG